MHLILLNLDREYYEQEELDNIDENLVEPNNLR